MSLTTRIIFRQRNTVLQTSPNNVKSSIDLMTEIYKRVLSPKDNKVEIVGRDYGAEQGVVIE